MYERFKAKVIALKGEPGSSGDYNGQTNKPKINGTTLLGNMTAAQLGLATAAQAEQINRRIDEVLANDTAAYAGVQMNTYTSSPAYMTYDSARACYTVIASWSIPAGSVLLEAAWAKEIGVGETYNWQRGEDLIINMSSTNVQLILKHTGGSAPAYKIVLRATVAVTAQVDLSELTDIRTDVDGTVHESAGAAVRAQIEALTDRIASLETSLNGLTTWIETLDDNMQSLNDAAETKIVEVSATISSSGDLINPTASMSFEKIKEWISMGAPIFARINHGKLLPLAYLDDNAIAFEVYVDSYPESPDENMYYGYIGFGKNSAVSGMVFDSE
jgi:hypothetical protein